MTRRVLGRTDVIVLPRLVNLLHDDLARREIGKLLANDAARQCLVNKLIPRLVELRSAA